MLGLNESFPDFVERVENDSATEEEILERLTKERARLENLKKFLPSTDELVTTVQEKIETLKSFVS